jgi:glycosyltransferase 2 family protein
LSYILSLYASLRAVAVRPGLEQVAGVYLVGGAAGAVSPTPGGLGVMEATLVAGLTATGVPAAPAVTGVLAFRLLTFWLPILPGALALRALRRNGLL